MRAHRCRLAGIDYAIVGHRVYSANKPPIWNRFSNKIAPVQLEVVFVGHFSAAYAAYRRKIVNIHDIKRNNEK